jgi:hopanoid biosynthesis associated RND transporter like protein HpnN
VLFIGLGIDFSIQFCLRYRELNASSGNPEDALARTATGVGKALLLCTITTSIGFYAFVPTEYAGVSELGIIAGTGMFINLFVNLTLLPALLGVIPLAADRKLPFSFGAGRMMLPYKYPRTIILGALVLSLAAALMLPKVYFDYNPLNLYDQDAESVSTAKELYEDSETSPWTSSALATGQADAEGLAKKLNGLDVVENALTLSDFVPEGQDEKLSAIDDIALFMPEIPEDMAIKTLDCGQQLKALDAFEADLNSLVSSGSEGSYYDSAGRLSKSIGRFKRALRDDPAKGERAFGALEKALLFHLPDLLDRLETSLQAKEFGVSDLPRDLAERFVSRDGRYRIQIFPRENITDIDALERFVTDVRSVAPDATDSPVVILETGKTIIGSFRQATLSALILITIVLLIVLRRVSRTVMVLIPLFLAILFSLATSALLKIPLNYANVIVIPLLLGAGVANGIHFVQRYFTEPPPDGNMLKTSTARAVFFSSLTTIMSFSSLSFSAHRGTASMGKLLTICMGFLIINTLILLPTILKIYEGRREKGDGSTEPETSS